MHVSLVEEIGQPELRAPYRATVVPISPGLGGHPQPIVFACLFTLESHGRKRDRDRILSFLRCLLPNGVRRSDAPRHSFSAAARTLWTAVAAVHAALRRLYCATRIGEEAAAPGEPPGRLTRALVARKRNDCVPQAAIDSAQPCGRNVLRPRGAPLPPTVLRASNSRRTPVR